MTDDIFAGRLMANGNEKSNRKIIPSCNSLLYHMEQKYLCDQYVESSIDFFGTSPCQLANEKGLELLVLDRCDITDIGNVDRVSTFVQNVNELDLSWNRISSWSTVAALLSSMPALKLLNLSHNPLNVAAPLVAENYGSDRLYQKRERRCNSTGELDESSRDSCYLSSSACSSSFDNMMFRDDDPEASSVSIQLDLSLPAEISCIPICEKLSTLILNGVNLPMRTIHRFIGAAPLLRELHLADNPINVIELDALINSNCGPFSTTVEVLNLSGCQIHDWATVLRFMRLFPNIFYLLAAENDISCINFDDGLLPSKPVIRSLTLNDNKIDTWSSIERLSKLSLLDDLRIRNIPLFADLNEDERIHLVVGRLQSLNCLNGSEITPFHREESERFFIRYYQNLDDRPSIYNELVNRHGHLEQLVKVDLTPRRFANVFLRCDETGYNMQARIRLNCTVQELMKHAEKVTGIAVSRMRIFYFDFCVPVELRLPNQKLYALHVQDGDEFIIQSKILLAKQSPIKQHKHY